MRRFIMMLVAVVVSVGFASAQDPPKAAAGHKAMASHTMKGYLVDKMCATKMVKAGEKKAMAKAKNHPRECAMEESCAASGYGLVSAGKFYPFDANGNTLAAAYLKDSKKDDNLEVQVLGTMEGDNIKVEKIHDVVMHGKKK